MTLIDEINRIRNNIENAYIKCEEKGAIIPSPANIDNLADSIDTISLVSSSNDVTGIPRSIYENSYIFPTSGGSGFSFTFPKEATRIGNKALANSFFCNHTITNVTFPEIISIDDYGLYNSFYSCINLKSVNFPKLTSIEDFGLLEAFAYSYSITELNFPNLKTIGSSGLDGAFISCSALTSISFPKLTTIGNGAFYRAFMSCGSLESISFPAVTRTSFQLNSLNDMLPGVANCDLHFPSNVEPSITGLDGYDSGFGGTNTNIWFDL